MKIILILATLFILTGCTMPTAPTGFRISDEVKPPTGCVEGVDC